MMKRRASGTPESALEIVPFEATMSDACESILRALPEWFGIPASNEEYIRSLARLTTFVARLRGSVVGFVAFEQQFPESAENHVLAVHPDYHRRGIGRALLAHAEQWLCSRGVEVVHVKTLGPSNPYPPYAKTRAFYKELGFRPLFESTRLWGPENPALIMAKPVAPVGGLPLGAQLDAKSIIARIEAPQAPDRGGLDGLSIPQMMQLLGVPGVSIAVINDFRIHWVKTYGVADVETGRLVDPATMFQAASISKPVTAMAVLRLAQEQRLRLDDDINAVLQSWRVPPSALTRDQPVTARSLMSHTSGADDGFGFPGYDPSAPRPTLVQVLNGQAPSNVGPVLFARSPYQGYKYSGGGIVLMELALTDLTGLPFADFMQASVLIPLGMTNSSFAQPMGAAMAAHAARAHDEQGHRMSSPWHIYPEQAAAGLWTTPTDLAQFVIEVQSAVRGPQGQVLTRSSAREMVAPVGTGPFAVGLMVEKRGEGWYFSHGGSNWGFRADIIGHVRKGYGVVVMTNSDAGTPLITEIESRVAAAYGWDSLDKPLVR